MRNHPRWVLSATGIALLTLTACGPASDDAGTSGGSVAAECAIESTAGPVLVHFGSEGHAHADGMAAVLSGVQADFGDGLAVVKIDIDSCPELAESHDVDRVPTVVLLRDGIDDVKVVGWVSREHLDTWLTAHGVSM